MKDSMEFEMLLDDVLREVANPEPREGLMRRLALRMEMAAASKIYETAQNALFESSPKQEGLFLSIWSGLQELISPTELQPLAPESRPVAMVDRMGARRSFRATGWAVAAHVFAILMIGYAATTQIHIAAPVDLRTTALADPPQSLSKLSKAER